MDKHMQIIQLASRYLKTTEGKWMLMNGTGNRSHYLKNTYLVDGVNFS